MTKDPEGSLSVMSPVTSSSPGPGGMGFRSSGRRSAARLPRSPFRSMVPTVPPAPVIGNLTAQASPVDHLGEAARGRRHHLCLVAESQVLPRHGHRHRWSMVGRRIWGRLLTDPRGFREDRRRLRQRSPRCTGSREETSRATWASRLRKESS